MASIVVGLKFLPQDVFLTVFSFARAALSVGKIPETNDIPPSAEAADNNFRRFK